MITVFHFLLFAICSSALGVFSFWIGRCARRLPIIDSRLPWTMRRDQVPRVISEAPESETRRTPRPQGDLCELPEGIPASAR